MTDLDEILYNAVTADTSLMTVTSGRIKSTCFEVSPEEQDNTPLPYIIVSDDGLTNDQTTKDNTWESSEDRVQASVEVGAKSPKQVKQLIRQVRKAVYRYVSTMKEEDVPYLLNVQTSGVAWDWTKPCYFSSVSYQCIVDNNLEDDEQEEQ